MAARNLPGGGIPVPIPDEDNAPFWEGCRAHELRIQHCLRCGTAIHYPRAACHACQGLEFEYRVASGRGTVYSFIVAHQAFHPAFRDRTPYNVVLVELDDMPGVRLASEVVGVEPGAVRIGMPVEVTWDDVTDEISLYRFRPRAS